MFESRSVNEPLSRIEATNVWQLHRKREMDGHGMCVHGYVIGKGNLGMQERFIVIKGAFTLCEQPFYFKEGQVSGEIFVLETVLKVA